MLYGNVTNTTQTAFQFDKIYTTRYAMDRNISKDGIAPGRFVLVSYGYDKNLNAGVDDGYPITTEDDYLCCYHNYYDQTTARKTAADGEMYIDPGCTTPYRYTTFTEVRNPSESSIGAYYIQRNDMFFKAPYWVEGETYYLPSVGSSVDMATVVTTGAILRRRYSNLEDGATINGNQVVNPSPNMYTEEFYECVGCIQSNPSVAKFQPINLSLNESDSYISQSTPYLHHYNIDYRFYRAKDDTWGTLHRGYDSTVWQKVVGEGESRYVLIAHLNSIAPGLEIVAEPPTEDMSITPFIGADSTDMLYRLHMPNPWGLSAAQESWTTMQDPDNPEKIVTVAEADPDGISLRTILANEHTYYVMPSDETYTLQKYNRNPANGESTLSVTKTVPMAVYYNKDGFNKEVHVLDDQTLNSITLTPTGKSANFDTIYGGSVFYNKDNAPHADTQELKIMLPAVGNMIATGYDMVYGDGLETGNSQHKRHLDTKWYSSEQTDLIEHGDVTLGGKTFDLDTMAGTLNTMHNRLGQIIQEIRSVPNEATIDAEWDESTIYHLTGTNHFYRKGRVIQPTAVNYQYYRCTGDYAVNANNYEPYVYYKEYATAPTDHGYPIINATVIEGNSSHQAYLEADYSGAYDSSATYVYRSLANDASAMYQQITLEQYQPRQFYRKSGDTYIRANGNLPQDSHQRHVTISKGPRLTFSHNFSEDGIYVKNGDNYKLKTESVKQSGVTYYNITPSAMIPHQTGISGGWVYKPGVYYYYNETNTVAYLDTGDTPDSNRNYYYFQFSDTPIRVITTEGTVTEVYQVVQTTAVGFNPANNGRTFYYLNDDGTYVLVTADWLKSRTYEFFTQPRMFYEIALTDITNQLFSPDAYYIWDVIAETDENNQPRFDTSNNPIETQESLRTKGNFVKATANNYSPNNYYYDITVTAVNPFYYPNTYYYKLNSVPAETPPILDAHPADQMQSQTDGKYYELGELFVFSDALGECPYGYSWERNYTVIPWPLELKIRRKVWGTVELFCENGQDSINGTLLNISKKTEMGNPDTRDTTVLQGVINRANDKFYALGNCQAEHITYVNRYGRLTSSSVTNGDLVSIKSSKHSHSNKSVLDSITSQKVTAWNNTESNITGTSADQIVDTGSAVTGLTLYGLLNYIKDLEDRIEVLEG